MKALLNFKLGKSVCRAFSTNASPYTWEKVGYPPAYDALESNLTPRVWDMTKRKLYLNENHPIAIIKDRILKYFAGDVRKAVKIPFRAGERFLLRDDFNPIVSTKKCFDDLLIPADHVSRRKSDTYYINKDTLLRTHTSAHQIEAMAGGEKSFVIFGDVYRRDEIDHTHYPAFHQLEGIRLFDLSELGASNMVEAKKIVVEDLKGVLEGLAMDLFGKTKNKWVDAYFPFTQPSMELEMEFNSSLMEMLGCGVIHDEVLRKAGKDPSKECGWAFGIGVERWTMKLFGIPDIKLFWSNNERFLRQFKKGTINKFIDYGKNPSCYRDVSFWISKNKDFSDNELYEVAREVAGDVIEYIKCIDIYSHPKRNTISKCYRFAYCHRDKAFTSAEVEVFHSEIRARIAKDLQVTLR